MNITPWQLYWITRLDSVGCALLVLFVVGCLGIGAGILMWFDSYVVCDNETQRERGKNIVAKFSVAFIFGILAIFVPSSKEMAAILIIPRIVNNEKINQLPDKLLELTNAWVEELKPEKKKE